MMKSVKTRFRAYQLGNAGSLFSFLAEGHFTLVEARLTSASRHTLLDEMEQCGVIAADTLHITSWDADHCAASELNELLDLVRPSKIECPGYAPTSENGKKSLDIISAYRTEAARSSNRGISVQQITPEYITGLIEAEELSFKHIFYNPRHIDHTCANNNSTVKMFRSGSFNVLSLGDVEDSMISARLRRCKLLKRETDVMILAHHGADNGFTNKSFLERIEPSLAICSSNYENTYDHPRQEVRDLLYECGIRLMTTKTGDVLVRSIGDHTGRFRATNYKAQSTEISLEVDFVSKKSKLLGFNRDTIRQLNTPKPFYRGLR